MSLDDFLLKEKKDSKKPTIKDESSESPSDSITSDESPPISLSSAYLWSLLVETVKNDIVTFPRLKVYVESKILPNEPNITPEELAIRLSVSIGTALVILSELKSDYTSK
ncbi:MAG: hypothetical protein ACFFCD_00545 [Promethearchaeota archaeon]